MSNKPGRVVFVVLFCLASAVSAADDLCKTVAPMTGPEKLNLEGEAKFVPEGPGGRTVLRADGDFSGRIDLGAMGIDPADYDLLKLQVRAGRAARLRFSLENYPNARKLTHWYVLDGMRGAFDWRTLWVDLRSAEEIKPPGYKGMADTDPSLKGLRFHGGISDPRRAKNTSERALWLGEIRLCKHAVALEWDQTRAPYTWGRDRPLTYTYPLEVSNRLDRRITVVLELLPFQTTHATAGLSQDKTELAPGETKTVEARITLPAEVAAKAAPLYTERFEVRARAEEIPDSDVTLLRSSDPVHLVVTVPVDEKVLARPLLPRPSRLPAEIVQWNEQLARQTVGEHDVDRLVATLKHEGWIRKAPGYMHTLVSAGSLYDFTGEQEYLEVAKKLLAALPETWKVSRERWASDDVRPISSGIVTASTLSLGWRVGGTQRAPYLYGTSGNQRAGGLGAIAYVFDFLRPKLDKAFKRTMIDEFFLPAAIQARNHYIGPGNQQSTANVVALYGGLMARNWPLVAFACSAEHGLLGNIEWGFDDDGLCLEGHYQSYTCRPVLWATEILHGAGIDLYDARLYQVLHSKGAEAIGMAYRDEVMSFIDAKRFGGRHVDLGERTDGYQLSSSTLLRWKGLDVAMNWGTHIMRSSADRCALTVRAADRALRALQCGGGSYNHSSFGQSIVIVDEQVQNSVPATVSGFDVVGPVQFVQAVSERHYPGTRIVRTFALLGDNVLIVDRVRATDDQPHTIDWQLNGAGNKLSVETTEKQGSWTDKPDDKAHGHVFGGGVRGYQTALTSGTWTEGDGRLTMLGAPDTRILVWEERGSRMIVRRHGVQATEFIAMLSLKSPKIERVPVKTAAGGPADALGLKVTLEDGKIFHAVTNYEPDGAQVTCGPLTTAERFASDF